MDPLVATLLGGVISGGVAAKLIDIFWGYLNGRISAKRNETDRMAKLLKESNEAKMRAERRAHLALVWGRRLELKAVQYGVPDNEMPILDFKDD